MKNSKAIAHGLWIAALAIGCGNAGEQGARRASGAEVTEGAGSSAMLASSSTSGAGAGSGWNGRVVPADPRPSRAAAPRSVQGVAVLPTRPPPFLDPSRRCPPRGSPAAARPSPGCCRAA